MSLWIVAYLLITVFLGGYLDAQGTRDPMLACLWPLAAIALLMTIPLFPVFLVGRWVGLRCVW